MRKTTWGIIAVGSILISLFFAYREPILEFVRSLAGPDTNGTIFTSTKHPDRNNKKQITTPNQMLVNLRHSLRPKPDARFLSTVTEIHAFAENSLPQKLQIEFIQNRWQIALEGKTGFLFLPEIPSFTDGINLARTQAGYLIAKLKLIPPEPATATELKSIGLKINTFHPIEINSLLKKLNDIWVQGTHAPQVLKLAAQALCRLAYISLDDVETSDLVQSRALALLALAQVATKEPMILEESLLAHRMGYGTHAKNLAKQLPGSTAWRRYLEHKDSALAQAAQQSSITSDIGYFWIQRLAELKKTKLWAQELNRRYSQTDSTLHALVAIQDLASGYSLPGFWPKTTISKLMPHFILGILIYESKPSDIGALLLSKSNSSINTQAMEAFVGTIYSYLNGNPGMLIDYFESNLETASQKFHGPFIDSRTYQSFYRGYFFSSLYRLGIHYLDKYSSVEAATQFANVLGNSDRGTAHDFQLWYRNLVAAKKGKADMEALLTDLSRLPNFGLPPALRTLEEQLPLYKFGSPEISTAVKFIIQRMDTRITHRYKLANIARKHLLYLSRAETLYQSIRRDNPAYSRSLEAWLGMYYGNPETIIAVAKDPSSKPYVRAKALTFVDDIAAYDSEVRAVYNSLVAKYPTNWSIHKRFILFLEKRRDYKTAIQTARSWLNLKKDDATVFDHWQAVISISRIQVLQGRYKSAWKTIEPIVESYYGGAMRQAVDVSIAMEDYKTARDIAERLTKRYPDYLKSVLPLVKVHWSEGNYSEAAKILKQWPFRITEEEWRWTLGSSFSDLFSKKPEKGLLAFKALLDAGINHWALQEFAVEVNKRNNPELAFNMQSRLKWSGPGYIEMLVRAYGYLGKWKSHEVAVKWLDKRIPIQMRNFSSMIFFGELQYPLLWELIPYPEKNQYPEAVWLARAAAYIEGARLSDEQERLLRSYYQNANSGHYDLLGKYLLGMAKVTEIADSSMNSRKISEAAFYLGLRALYEKRYYAAADWYRVSIETGEYKNGEYRWSYDRLYVWKNKQRSLTALASSGEIYRGLQ